MISTFARPAFYTEPSAVSYAGGSDAVRLAELAGLTLDPWQAWALERSLGERPDGSWAAFEVALILPRQNGKGALIEARELAGLFLHEDERLILHSAHEFKTAEEAFRRIRSLIETTPSLSRQVKRVTTAHGSEGIELKNGKRLKFVARSGGSGRGFSGDTLILDEAYALSGAEMAALLPTLSARKNPQVWYTSSAGMASSVHLRSIRDRGRAGAGHRLAYMEWCAQPGADGVLDLDDRAGWGQANPGKDVRISEDFIAAERGALPDDEFARERLGRWDEPATGEPAYPVAPWTRCLETVEPMPALTGRLVLAADMSWNRQHAAIVAASERIDGRFTLDVIDYRTGSTEWLMPRLQYLNKAHRPAWIVIDPAGPAGSIRAQLESSKLPVRLMSSRDMAQACGDLYDLIDTGSLRHLGQPELDTAVAGAIRLIRGDAWTVGRTKSSADISPLVAAIAAVWGVRNKRINYGASVW